MTTVDLSWKLRAQKAESQLAERDRELQQAQQNLDADLRDWRKLADEMGCESTREAMSKRIKELRGELQQAREERDEALRHLNKVAHELTEESGKHDNLARLTEPLRGQLSEAREEIARLKEVEENLADYASRFFRLFDQYRGAWLREMGGVIRPKHWEIDGFALRAKDIYEKAQLVDRIKQCMLKKVENGKECTAMELFDAVFKMLAEDGRDKIPTN